VEKLVYLLWPRTGLDGDALRDTLLADAAPELVAAGAHALTINVADGAADVPTPMPWPEEEPRIAAEVSVWVDCHDRRELVEEILGGAAARLAGYLVSEALYRDYGGNRFSAPRHWPDGERSPGVLMLTLLERPARLEREAWIAHWHGTQSPVSEAIQPRMRYVRNEVIRPLTADAPPYEGIVEECWPSAEHLTDPMLFYLAEGSEERMQAHVREMMESVNAFLDLGRIRSVNMSEYLVRSLPPRR
jgi:hypothetical protein